MKNWRQGKGYRAGYRFGVKCGTIAAKIAIRLIDTLGVLFFGLPRWVALHYDVAKGVMPSDLPKRREAVH